MRADALFAALDAAPVASLAELAGSGGILVVAPHPDDESLGCGGLVAAARRAGRAVRLVVLSDGCGSHTRSRLFPALVLREQRERETRDAAAILGVPPDAITFLRLPDAAVPAHGPDADAAVAAIEAAARAVDASAICVTWRHDPHCDHEAAASLVDRVRPRLRASPSLEGVRVLFYPVWGRTLAPDTEIGMPGRLRRLDVSAERERKRRAVAMHRSQVTDLVADDPTGFRLPAAMVDRLCGPFEPFIEEQQP